MIMLDTNTVSELWRPTADVHVQGWVDAQVVETLFLAAISVAELRYGIAVLPNGKKKQNLRQKLEEQLLPLFRGRVLPFDEAAAGFYGELRAIAKKKGKPIAVSDGYIAATAKANGLAIATRDTGPFLTAGLNVINPWVPT